MTAMIVLGGAALIVAGLLRSNLNFYMTIDQLKQSEDRMRVRVVGEVADGSWEIGDGPGRYRFTLKDKDAAVPVCYSGAPIDVKPGRQIVVEGVLGVDGTFQADRILMRCASRYAAEGKGAPR